MEITNRINSYRSIKNNRNCILVKNDSSNSSKLNYKSKDLTIKSDTNYGKRSEKKFVIRATSDDVKTLIIRKEKSYLSAAKVSHPEERIVPNCLRRCCRTAIMKKTNLNRGLNCCRLNRNVDTTELKSKKSKKKQYKHHSKRRKRNKVSEQELYSPISQTPFWSDRELSYDSISTDDFCFEKEDQLEYKLDMLIKRAKERERNKVKRLIEEKPVHYSNIEDSSMSFAFSPSIADLDDTTLYGSDMDVSIHSLATVVLGPDAYSPNDSIHGTLLPSPVHMLSPTPSNGETKPISTIKKPYSPSMSTHNMYGSVTSIQEIYGHDGVTVKKERKSSPILNEFNNTLLEDIKPKCVDLLPVVKGEKSV